MEGAFYGAIIGVVIVAMFVAFGAKLASPRQLPFRLLVIVAVPLMYFLLQGVGLDGLQALTVANVVALVAIYASRAMRQARPAS